MFVLARGKKSVITCHISARFDAYMQSRMICRIIHIHLFNGLTDKNARIFYELRGIFQNPERARKKCEKWVKYRRVLSVKEKP